VSKQTIQNPEAEMRDLSSKSLRNTTDSINELKSTFEECSDLFEEGEDAKALDKIKEMLPHLKEFVNFCYLINQNCYAMVVPSLSEQMDSTCKTLLQYLQDLVKESEQGNFIASADILRIDLTDILEEYKTLFASYADALDKGA